MAELKNVEFYPYEEDDSRGFVVDPESETKMVFIPSPPTTVMQKINPRTPVLYLTGGKISESYEKLDALKAYCAEQKLVFICPASDDAEEVSHSYEYLAGNERNLNIKKDRLVVKAAAGSMDAAQEAMDYLIDELDVEFEDEDIETFDL